MSSRDYGVSNIDTTLNNVMKTLTLNISRFNVTKNSVVPCSTSFDCHLVIGVSCMQINDD